MLFSDANALCTYCRTLAGQSRFAFAAAADGLLPCCGARGPGGGGIADTIFCPKLLLAATDVKAPVADGVLSL